MTPLVSNSCLFLDIILFLPVLLLYLDAKFNLVQCVQLSVSHMDFRLLLCVVCACIVQYIIVHCIVRICALHCTGTLSRLFWLV